MYLTLIIITLHNTELCCHKIGLLFILPLLSHAHNIAILPTPRATRTLQHATRAITTRNTQDTRHKTQDARRTTHYHYPPLRTTHTQPMITSAVRSWSHHAPHARITQHTLCAHIRPTHLAQFITLFRTRPQDLFHTFKSLPHST
jgi:hypothetical protein